MQLTKDMFQIVCPQIDNGGFHCPGANEFGACKLYINDGVRAKARKGCAFKEIRRPAQVKKKSAFINPLKASKRKVKTGEQAVEGGDEEK